MATPDHSAPGAGFDFDQHRRVAIDAYQKIRPLYEDLADAIGDILKEALDAAAIKVASVEARAKTLESFGQKAVEPSDASPNLPKYRDPLKEITDLAGTRVITFFPRTVEEVDRVVTQEFVVRERTDKAELLKQEDKLGYQSVHYLVSLKPNRTSLPEYNRFGGLVAEIQVRTILQHAWAEIEHDIQYKSVETIPSSIRRRFMSLAGLFEIADREFQAIQDEDEALRQAARASVSQGKLDEVEITPDALKAYLDRRVGSDGRMSQFSYDWTARLLRRLGFKNFRQIDECIAPYNDDAVSRVAWGSRQGQLGRFETQLLAAMGEKFLARHPFSTMEWFQASNKQRLERLQSNGIRIGDYEPRAEEGSSP